MSVDLVCVVADKCIEAALAGLLEHKRLALGLRDIAFDIHVHPRRDPGCYHDGPVLLQGLLGGNDARGLLVFDQAWDGNPHPSAVETERAIRERLSSLFPRADVLVIEPELEAWVWSTSPHVADVLGWEDVTTIRNWLVQQGLWRNGNAKPNDPKAAMDAVLFERRVPRSSALYRGLARRASLSGCQDDSFRRFTSILKKWFGAGGSGESA